MAANDKDLYVTQTGMTIDPSHAFFNIVGVDKVFNTIQVRSYQPLQEALQQGVIEPETKLMLFEVGENVISIPLRLIAFHHVAQGEYDNQKDNKQKGKASQTQRLFFYHRSLR